MGRLNLLEIMEYQKSQATKLLVIIYRWWGGWGGGEEEFDCVTIKFTP